MQSYSGVDFVSNEATASLLCSLCGLVLCDAAATDNYDDDEGLAPCDHIFCQRCIDKHLESGSTCPFPECHRALNSSQLFPELATQNKVGSLEVRCKCGWTGLLGNKGAFLLEHRATCSVSPSSSTASPSPTSSTPLLSDVQGTSLLNDDEEGESKGNSSSSSTTSTASSSSPSTGNKAVTENGEVHETVVHVREKQNNITVNSDKGGAVANNNGGKYLYGAGGSLEQKRQAWRAQAATVQPKGHPRENFTFPDEFLKQFICQLCEGVFRDAMMLDNFTASAAPCGHCFCNACIVDWLSINKSCPSCDRPVEPTQIYAELLLRRRVWDLKVRCKYYHRDCRWEGILGKEGVILQDHEAKCKGKTLVAELEDLTGSSEIDLPLTLQQKQEIEHNEIVRARQQQELEQQQQREQQHREQREREKEERRLQLEQEQKDMLLASPYPNPPDETPVTPAIPDFFDPRIVDVKQYMEELMSRSVQSTPSGGGGQGIEEYVKSVLNSEEDNTDQDHADLPPLVSITAPLASSSASSSPKDASSTAPATTTTPPPTTTPDSTTTTTDPTTTTTDPATLPPPTTSDVTISAPSTSATTTTTTTAATTPTSDALTNDDIELLKQEAPVLPRPSSPSLPPSTPAIPEIVSLSSTTATTSSTSTSSASLSVPPTLGGDSLVTDTATITETAASSSTTATTTPTTIPTTNSSSATTTEAPETTTLPVTTTTTLPETNTQPQQDGSTFPVVPFGVDGENKVIEVSTSELEVLPEVPHLKCKWPLCIATFTCQAESDIHATVCPHRLIMCSLCGKSNSVITAADHPKICPMTIVGCPNQCQGGDLVRRKDVQTHIATQCQEVEEPCAYKAQGCQTMIKRKHTAAHAQTEASAHLTLVTKAMVLQQETITALTARLDALEAKAKQRDIAPDWLNEIVTCTRIGCGLKAPRKDVPKTRCSWHTAPPATVSVMRCKKSFGCKADFNRCFVYPCCGYCKACMDGCQTGTHEIAEVRPPPS